MSENLTETIHGTLLSVYGIGVLLRGDSGTGKSECALEMVSRGHALVADDAVELKRIGSILYGAAPDALKGLLEVRGLGICDIRELYGESFVVHRCGIGVCIDLHLERNTEEIERIGSESAEIDFLGVKLPHFVITDSINRLAPLIIEASVKMTRSGGRSAEMDLIANYNRSLAS